MKETPLIFTADSVRAILEGRKAQTRRVIQPQPKDHLVHGSRLERSAAGDEPTAKDRAIWHVYRERDNHYEPFGVCPYGVPGDRIWVREKWAYFGGDEYLYQKDNFAVFHAATWESERAQHFPRSGLTYIPGDKWRSPIFMPRWASRLTLEITEIRVQRVQEISEEDAATEGISCDSGLECECGWLGWENSRGVTRTDGEDWSFLCPKCGETLAHHPIDEQGRMEYRKLWDAINAKRYPWKDNPWVWAITFRRLP